MLSDPFMANMTQEDVEVSDTAPAVFLIALRHPAAHTIRCVGLYID